MMSWGDSATARNRAAESSLTHAVFLENLKADGMR